MAWQISEASETSAGPRSTLLVSGADDRAVATLMALLRELGWAAHGASAAQWRDEALASAVNSGDATAVQIVVDQRYHLGERWQLRFPVEAESYSGVLPRLQGVHRIVVVDDDAAVSSVSAAAAPATMVVSAAAAIECSESLLEAVADFVGQGDAHRRACASRWLQLLRGFPELPFGLFKTNGTLDRVGPKGGGGWAYIEGVDAPVELEIRVGEQWLIVTADRPRPDLLERGFHPTGNCGFSFSFAVKVAAGESVHARIVGDRHELINSPAEVVAPGGKKGLKQPPPAVLLGERKLGPDAPPIELLDLPRIKPRPSHRVFVSSLWAFLMREIRSRFGTRRGGYLWGIVEPAFQVIILTMLVRGIKGRFEGKIYGEDLVFFFSLGVIPYQMFSHALSGAGIMAGNGLFNFRQIRPIDIGLVRGFLDFLLYGVIFALMLGIANWLGYDYTVDKPLEFLYCIFLLFWMGFSIGLFFDVMSSVVRQARIVQTVFTRAMYITSGVIYSIDSLPQAIKPYLLWNPMLHIIDEIRATCMKGYPARGDIEYAAECTLLFLFISLAFYRRNLYRLF
jgi:capsular polysaccharide transport system permease protein